jgi:hypothetical protein
MPKMPGLGPTMVYVGGPNFSMDDAQLAGAGRCPDCIKSVSELKQKCECGKEAGMVAYIINDRDLVWKHPKK